MQEYTISGYILMLYLQIINYEIIVIVMFYFNTSTEIDYKEKNKMVIKIRYVWYIYNTMEIIYKKRNE